MAALESRFAEQQDLSQESCELLDSVAVLSEAIAKESFGRRPDAVAFFQQFKQQGVQADYGAVRRCGCLSDRTLITIGTTGALWVKDCKIHETALTFEQGSSLMLDLQKFATLQQLEYGIKEIISPSQVE